MKRLDKGLHLHFDPISGIAGDMTVAALVDAGVPRQTVTEAISAMNIPGLTTRFERRQRGAFAGTGFVVSWPSSKGQNVNRASHAGHAHRPDHGEHRDYAQIRRLLKRASIDSDVRALAEEIFAQIAEAESTLHGVAIDRVVFHEIGAYDSIADIVGAAAAIVWLAPVAISATAPVVGTGVVRTAHGLVPVPAPATAVLLQGIPVRAEGEGELTTPTGAAILAAVVDTFGALPPVRLAAQGFGAGSRELADRPNVLRVILGEPLGQPLADSVEEALLVESNIDDMNPQLVQPLLTALFAAGAVDAWTTPILMKKGRPALTVSALVPVPARDAVAHAFFAHSTTIGLRTSPVARTVLARSMGKVTTAHGEVPVKLSALDGRVVSATPEFDVCQRLADRAKIPVRVVVAAAQAEATFRFGLAERKGRG